jgi:hypothetical protein
VPATITGRSPKREMMKPLASDGRYIASRCTWITRAVAISSWPSITCMLIGVAVMMKLITA